MRYVVLFLILLAAFFTEELYRYVFCRGSSRLFIRLFDSKGHEPAYYDYRNAGIAAVNAQPHQTYTIRSDRGETLTGFYYPCGSRGKTIAFILHGYRSDHADTGGMVLDYYKSRGIDLFICDHTAAGESGGHFIGFDVLESRDCLKWVDFLISTFGPDTRIILHGFSMGAATAMQMSSQCPKNVRFIVEDSGYESAHTAMDHQVGPMFGPLRLINRLVAGYDWNDSSVTASLDAARVPMLFVHGKDDRLVPYPDGPRLYARYQGPKDCLFSENTRHVESFYKEPAAYAAKIDGFLEQYLEGRPEREEITP